MQHEIRQDFLSGLALNVYELLLPCTERLGTGMELTLP